MSTSCGLAVPRLRLSDLATVIALRAITDGAIKAKVEAALVQD
ncbi:hypothetical protein PI125_g5388 [Phytophthora idaei]|nr:hypothetical protein PI125_g5388 [Phytophthora idaei]